MQSNATLHTHAHVTNPMLSTVLRWTLLQCNSPYECSMHDALPAHSSKATCSGQPYQTSVWGYADMRRWARPLFDNSHALAQLDAQVSRVLPTLSRSYSARQGKRAIPPLKQCTVKL